MVLITANIILQKLLFLKFVVERDYFKKDLANQNIDVPSRGFNINCLCINAAKPRASLPRPLAISFFSIIISSLIGNYPVMEKNPVSPGTGLIFSLVYIYALHNFNKYLAWGQLANKERIEKNYCIYFIGSPFVVFTIFFLFFSIIFHFILWPELHTHAFIVIALTIILANLSIYSYKQAAADER